MDKQNETITELTPDQMDKVSGGTGSGENSGYNDEPVNNNNAWDAPVIICPNNPNGKEHVWMPISSTQRQCYLCKAIENKIWGP